jgi:hypothetical protein
LAGRVSEFLTEIRGEEDDENPPSDKQATE